MTLQSLQHHLRSPFVGAASPAVLISRHVHHLKLPSIRVQADVTVAFRWRHSVLPRSVPSARQKCKGEGGSLSVLPSTPSICPLTPARAFNKIASFHLFFSFRPSWSSSTPAYGTLLPWERTMRRPLPVSPFFRFIFPVLFLRRFRHSAKDSLSLALSVSLPLALLPNLATCGPFCFVERMISSHQRVSAYHTVHPLV